VALLKARIETLEKITERQRAEIARLKAGGSPADDAGEGENEPETTDPATPDTEEPARPDAEEPDTEEPAAEGPAAEGPAAKKPAPPITYTYRGKERTKQWFDKKYKTYRHQVAMIGDSYRFIDNRSNYTILRFIDNRSNYTILRTPPDTIGAVRSGWGIVTQVIDEDEVFAKAPGVNSPTAYFHLRGIDTSTLVKGSRLRRRDGFLYLGDHEYVDAEGAKRRIQSYRLYKPLTREQFAEALAGGVILKIRVEGYDGRFTFTDEE
jgi:hypothetical protein